MSNNNSACQQPESLKSTPGECTTEQIRKCHGNEEGHTCTEPTEC